MPLPINLDFASIVKKLAIDCGIDSYTVTYVVRRLNAEGPKFLTVTLPSLSKRVLSSIEKGHFDRSEYTCFAWKAALLRPFAGLLVKIFSPVDGSLKPDACPVALWSIRQFCEYFYKLSFDFEPSVLSKAEETYEQTEAATAAYTPDFSWSELLRKNFETFYAPISRAHVHEVFAHSRPRNGPGAFAGFNRKVRDSFGVDHHALYKALPADEIGLCAISHRAFSGYFKSYPSSPELQSFVNPGDTCEVLFVPKDSRAPRVISKEPYHLIRAQLAYFDWLSQKLEDHTHQRVVFSDQSISQRLAREASITGEYATLDLKDASDRVPLRLIESIFLNSPACRWFISNTRSSYAQLPSGKVLALSKLAGMGSGLTFATMSLLIHLSIVSHVSRTTRIPYKQCMGRVYVYGDDVIVPREWYDIAVKGLSLSNLLVNNEKSFTKGPFRESCGGDYFKGNDVGPVRLKLTGANLRSPSFYKDGFFRIGVDAGILQLERHVRELYSSGLMALTAFYKGKLKRSLHHFPKVSGDSPYLGDYVYNPFEVGDPAEKAYMPINPALEFGRMDVFKHLGSHFKRRSGITTLDFLGSVQTTCFGEVALPRTVFLKLKAGFGVERR